MSSSPSPKVELWLSFNNTTMLALSIPTAEPTRFSVNPLKWLRFLGFAITGQKGYLSTSSTGPEISDYTEAVTARPYYFISQGEPHLVDADVIEGRTSAPTNWSASDVSSLSSHRAGFEQTILDRDGTCLVSGEPQLLCDASHIIPHSKGSDYMVKLLNYRGGIYNLNEGLDDINDPHNGLLLSSLLHRIMVFGISAFLKTPNFALTVDDIPKISTNDSSPTNRLTLHHFAPNEIGSMLTEFTPHNGDVRQPQDTSTWPPNIILDLFYASVALKTWGISTGFVEYVQKEVKGFYYSKQKEDIISKASPSASGQAQEDIHPVPSVVQMKKKAHPTEQPFLSDKLLRENQQQLQDSSTSNYNQDRIQAWLQSLEENQEIG